MADRTNILGVDFSGAKADKNTWVTQGTLHDGVLEIESCRPTPRAELAALLGSAPKNTIAALDFPFSVPRQFANHWLPEAESMPQLWQAAAGMEFQDFMALRDEFVADHGEPYRRGDLYFPECYSCLHKTNPNMVPIDSPHQQAGRTPSSDSMKSKAAFQSATMPSVPPPSFQISTNPSGL